MEIRQLRYYVEVAQLLSFSAAAQRLYVARSAISRQIMLLESELGVTLFERDGRAVRLTRAGERFLPEAIASYRQLDKLRKVRWDLEDEVGGSLVVGLPPSLLRALAAPAVTRFRSLYPKVDLRIEQAATSALCTAVIEGRLDLAVVSRLNTLQHLEPRTLAHEQAFLVGPRSADFGPSRHIAPDALVDYEHIVTPLAKLLLATHCRSRPPRIVAEVTDTGLAMDLVELGNGYAISFGCAIAERVAAGSLACAEIDGVLIEWVVIRQADRQPQAIDALFEQTLRGAVARGMAPGAMSPMFPAA